MSKAVEALQNLTAEADYLVNINSIDMDIIKSALKDSRIYSQRLERQIEELKIEILTLKGARK
jgi:hypothetical protein